MKFKDDRPGMGDILTAGILGGINPLLQLLLAPRAIQPPLPSMAIPESQIQHLGNYMRDTQMNSPETAPDYQWEVNDPSGRLGRMLTDEERRALLKLIQRRITHE